MSEELGVVARQGDRLLVSWQGDIDMANISSLEQRTLSAVQNSDWGLILDLTDVTYIDSAGIRALLAIRRRLEDRQQRLALVLSERSVLNRALEIGGVNAVISIYRSAEAALRE